jgi:hypothetical protein
MASARPAGRLSGAPRLATRAQPPFGRRGDRLGRRGRPFSRYGRRAAVYSARTRARGTYPCRPADPSSDRAVLDSLPSGECLFRTTPTILFASIDCGSCRRCLAAGTRRRPARAGRARSARLHRVVEAVAVGDNVEHQGAVATVARHWRPPGHSCRAPYQVAAIAGLSQVPVVRRPRVRILIAKPAKMGGWRMWADDPGCGRARRGCRRRMRRGRT